MIRFVLNDIFDIHADYIVNPSDRSLSGGGGVDRLIHVRAGFDLAKTCAVLSPCPVGGAILTDAFKLNYKGIIHAVVPRYTKQHFESAYLLASCYMSSLDIAKQNNAKSIVFVAMGTGYNGFPEEEAAKIAMSAVWAWSCKNKENDLNIIFTFREVQLKELFEKQLMLQITLSFKDICSPERLALSFRNTLPLYFDWEYGEMAKDFHDKKELTELYTAEFYQLHGLYSKYMYELYNLAGSPNYHKVVSDAEKRFGASGIAGFMGSFKCATTEECICFIVMLQRMDYASGGLDSTHIENCLNGNVYRVLEHMESLLRA